MGRHPGARNSRKPTLEWLMETTETSKKEPSIQPELWSQLARYREGTKDKYSKLFFFPYSNLLLIPPIGHSNQKLKGKRDCFRQYLGVNLLEYRVRQSWRVNPEKRWKYSGETACYQYPWTKFQFLSVKSPALKWQNKIPSFFTMIEPTNKRYCFS